jgi:hypothetical protein
LRRLWIFNAISLPFDYRNGRFKQTLSPRESGRLKWCPGKDKESAVI